MSANEENEHTSFAAEGEGEEYEEDLEKLQAEIARMEAEAARIARETEDLTKPAAVAAAASARGDAAAGGEKVNKDG